LVFYSFFGLTGLLLVLFAWAVRRSRKRTETSLPLGLLDECERRHVTYLPQIRQALAKTDYDFLSRRACLELQRRVRRQRRSVALAYLAALRGDFQSLLRMAKVIAVLSPEVAAVHEAERLRLTAKFAWQFQVIRWKLMAGLTPVPQLGGLSDLVSGLNIRIETAMKELGERAAAATDLASSMNGRGLDVA
jgi:hypothetical protein